MFKPLLAATVNDMDTLKYPVIASPKLDGIRCVILDGQPVSRKLKPIANRYIRQELTGLPSFDGELIIGDPTDKRAFNKTTSGVMSFEGEPDFRYHVFDAHSAEGGFRERHFAMTQLAHAHSRIQVVQQEWISTPLELREYEEHCLAEGYEGIMARDPHGRYKHGRSTLREGILGKIKRFADDEAEVISMVEMESNTNEAFTNELGNTKRSSAQAGKIPAGVMGALIVRSPNWVDVFNIGSGFDMATRKMFWENPDLIMGKTVKFKHQPIGAKDAPRFPIFIGIRED